MTQTIKEMTETIEALFWAHSQDDLESELTTWLTEVIGSDGKMPDIKGYPGGLGYDEDIREQEGKNKLRQELRQKLGLEVR